jgi:hypothetical protein
MWQEGERDAFADELYLAGEKVLPGIYRQVEDGREIYLEKEDFLPASLDGRVSCYQRALPRWGQIINQQRADVGAETDV